MYGDCYFFIPKLSLLLSLVLLLWCSGLGLVAVTLARVGLGGSAGPAKVITTL